ncbi:hypothetical protein EVAR_7597_1 [Eumeta japonica]|uniref:Rrn7/TAF1B N-terminal cyclin domain-containing protein n=1 Tax=Eumeta variegata TaxID=151549 RepID=A0A4C1SBK6_EUMVA|nr:hypothetical protein EVAR_7597_1 [Eumeta japonica]
MRSLQLISEFPNASFHFALESSRSGSVLGSGICARAAQSCVFALINSEYRAETSGDPGWNLPLALLDHCPDVVGKSTYGKVNLVCRRDVIGNAIEVWVSIFSSAVDTLFQLVILRKGIGLPPSGVTPEWHKWHTYNFILAGLADELIELGAKPSFKLKVLWIWTRYLNKYHKKIDNDDDTSIPDSEEDDEKEALEEHDTENEEVEYKPGIYAYNTDIKLITLGLLYAMCYVALNLDENDIQLSDLCRFIREEKEVDDDLYVYETKDRFKRYHSVKVRDKIVMEILDKINPGGDELKLSKMDFKGSLTPLTSYTETLLSHTNDPDLKLMLSEDFSAYSVSYIINGLDLRVEEKNILIGVSKEGKISHEEIKGNIPSRRAGSPLVYVRNCENKNWLVTKPPKQEHITATKENIDAVPDEIDDSTTILEISESGNVSDIIYKSETSTDLEEDTNLNIFDDSFKDFKDEDDTDQINDDMCEESNLNDQIESAFELNNVSGCVDQHHNEGNFINSSSHVSKFMNKDEIIKALIERKCREFSIPIPSDMNPTPVLKRKTNAKGNGPKPKKFKNRSKVPVEMTTHEIISSYITKLQNDFEETWRNSFRDCLNQNTFLQKGGIEQNPNKTEIDLNLIDETERKISSCDNTENTDNDSVVVHNDDDTVSDQEPPSSVPEDNSEFNENIYDIDQLYVKMKERKIDQVFFETDPQLLEILGKNGHMDRHVKKATKKIEIMKSRSQSSIETVKLKPLINLKCNIQEYRYWVKYYAGFALERNRFINQRFEDELDDSFPRSFTYVLRLCASILECTTVILYTQLCRQEKLLEGSPLPVSIPKLKLLYPYQFSGLDMD